MELSYVLPLRCESCGGGHEELGTYLEGIAQLAEVIVVDGSDPPIFSAHARVWPPGLRHLTPDPDVTATNGKVAGVTTGLRAASFEHVVIADDDVRWTAEQLRAVEARLRGADLVIPQNAFSPSAAWHARWDMARTLLNRAIGYDYPGTLAIRRSAFHGYDGDVLFENLELIRTIRASGGEVAVALDLLVPRRPPTTAAFARQRVRQAYDDLAQPARLVAELVLLPATIHLVRRRRWDVLAVAGGLSVALAEAGRRRAGGRAALPGVAAWFAPVWLSERAICVWIAVGSRVVRGGCTYRGVKIRRAATPMRVLRRRARVGAQTEGVERGGPAAWVPSHNGFVRDLPHRQSATTSRRTSSSSPSSSTSRTGPRTR